MSHCNLGHALRSKGSYAEALVELRKGHELGLKTPAWTYPSAAWVRDAESLVKLDRRLPEILEGKDKPADNNERLLLAHMCHEHKKLFAASARFFSEVFNSDAKLAANMESGTRYNAACAAALAGRGKGNDADKTDDKERARLRNQAIDWLHADLANWSKQVTSEKPGDRATVAERLKHWQEDPDLAGIRDKDALSKLPAEEQESFKLLWAEVDAVLKKAQEKPK
jgi:hypothetical protein